MLENSSSGGLAVYFHEEGRTERLEDFRATLFSNYIKKPRQNGEELQSEGDTLIRTLNVAMRHN